MSNERTLASTRLSEYAQDIRVLFETDWDDRYNIRSWDAIVEYENGDMAGLVIGERNDPGPQTGPRYYASVTGPFGLTENGPVYLLSGDYVTPEEIGVFFRLHKVVSRPTWKVRSLNNVQLSPTSPLSVVRGRLPDGNGRKVLH